MREDIEKVLKAIEDNRDKNRKLEIEHCKNCGFNKHVLRKHLDEIDYIFSNRRKLWVSTQPFREQVIIYALSLSNKELLEEVTKSTLNDAFYAQIIYKTELEARLKETGFI